MNVSIIVPNYNGEKLLEKNLPNVFEAASGYKGGRMEIIIVDDASTDASASVISNFKSPLRLRSGRAISNFKLVKNKKNLGFSSTVNRGVDEARGEVVVLLNTDVAPEKDFLDPLLSHFRDKNVFAVGCMDKSIEDGKVILRGRGIGRWRRGMLVHSRGEVNRTNTLWVSGGSGAFRKSLWDELGGFDTLYNPFYWEDIDISYRAQKAGYKILFEPESIVVHSHSKGAIKKQYGNFSIKLVAYRNQFIFVWKNITDPSLIISHSFWLPYHVFSALLRFDSAFFLGLSLAITNLPAIMSRRINQKKVFVKEDKDVLREFL